MPTSPTDVRSTGGPPTVLFPVRGLIDGGARTPSPTSWGRETLCASSNASELQRSLGELIAALLLRVRGSERCPPGPVFSFAGGLGIGQDSPALPEVRSPDGESQHAFVTALRASLSEQPLEDGMAHPAEEILGQALRSAAADNVLCSLEAWVLRSQESGLVADLLQCLGRREPPGTASWRSRLVRRALASKSIQVRDAAIGAAESWGGAEMGTVLRSHEEHVPWLREYLQDVLDDIAV